MKTNVDATNKAVLILGYESEIESCRKICGTNMEVIPATCLVNALNLLEDNRDRIDHIILNAHLCEIGNDPVSATAFTAISRIFNGKILVSCEQQEEPRMPSYSQSSNRMQLWH